MLFSTIPELMELILLELSVGIVIWNNFLKIEHLCLLAHHRKTGLMSLIGDWVTFCPAVRSPVV